MSHSSTQRSSVKLGETAAEAIEGGKLETQGDAWVAY
jgi:hypothetical protein